MRTVISTITVLYIWRIEGVWLGLWVQGETEMRTMLTAKCGSRQRKVWDVSSVLTGAKRATGVYLLTVIPIMISLY